MSAEPLPVLVTGANGHLGRKLLQRLAAEGRPARALVRSERAAARVREAVPDTPCAVVDWSDAERLRAALSGCGAVVHLVGIIRELPGTSYRDAHERTCEALVAAAKDGTLRRAIYLSILGSTPASDNPCLASKGRAEEILHESALDTTVLRVPMVLGPGDVASAALRGQARAPFLVWIGGGRSLQQPIDADDVVSAVLACLDRPELAGASLDLGGPECLTHRALVTRAAALWDRVPRGLPVPRGLVRGGVALLERVLPSPPMTTAMFDILQHDDRADPAVARERLGIEPTPLDDTLRRCVGPEAPSQ